MTTIICITSDWPSYEVEDLDPDLKKALKLISGEEIRVSNEGPGGYLLSLAAIRDALTKKGFKKEAQSLLEAYGLSLDLHLFTLWTQVPIPKWVATKAKRI